MGDKMEPSFLHLKSQLEIQELEAPAGVPSAQVYAQLLALYLLDNDLNNAKFLWKRIPHTVKSATPELGQIWEVGQKLWQRDLPAVYQSLKKEWTDPVKPVLSALQDCTRQRAIYLVGRAYSSISAEDFSNFVGLPVPQAVAAAEERGWQADPQTKIITPKPTERPPDPVMLSEQHLGRLTDFVSFLEN